MLRAELAFYIGCVNLHERLARKGEPTCMPLAAAGEEQRLSCRGLYDVGLTLTVDRRVVGNDANADRKDLAMETEGQVRTGAAGQVINQLPGKTMIMKNSSSSARLKFILFQVGPEALPLTVPVK